MTAIDNLNKVQEMRNFLICQVMYYEANGLSNSKYEQMEKKLQKMSFNTLDRKVTKLIGNWRLQYGY